MGFSSIFQLCVHFPATILETLVESLEISEFFSALFAHTYSEKFTKAFVTILSDFRETS